MIGSIVLASHQGLGYLAKDFYDNGVLDKVLVHKHSRRPSHPEWYPNSRPSNDENLKWLLDGLDAVLFFETPFSWKVIPMAREMGVKTVLMPMYECTPYPLAYEPDMILCPSVLDLDYYEDKNSQFVPVPVPGWVTWKERQKARTFVHNAGNGGLGGRNGTKELIEAFNHVQSDARLIIRCQEGQFKTKDPRIELRHGHVEIEELYAEGDVFIFPEKFNGLSLPLQEAYASGMPIMCGDRRPMNTWLPKELLFSVGRYHKERIAVEFDMAEYDPKVIAAKIDEWYDKDISNYSRMGKEWAEKTSWEVLGPKYKELCLEK